MSLRPESGIIWKDGDEKREPKCLRSGGWGHPFVTLLVRPKMSDTPPILYLEELVKLGTELRHEFEDWDLADLQEEALQVGATVKVTSGKYSGITGMVKSRTAAMLTIENIPNPVQLSSCEPAKRSTDLFSYWLY